MEFMRCDLCCEAYFITQDARSRHMRMCQTGRRSSSREDSTPLSPSTSRSSISSRQSGGPSFECDSSRKRKSPDLQPLDLSTKGGRGGGGSTPAKRYTSTSTPTSTRSTSPETDGDPPTLHWELRKALNSARDYKIRNPDHFYKDHIVFLQAALPVIQEILEDEKQVCKAFKYNLVLESAYSHPIQETSEVCNFKTNNRMVYDSTVDASDDSDDAEEPSDLIRRSLNQDIRKLLQEADSFETKGSGWSLDYPLHLILRVSGFKYRQITGECYVELPKTLKNRKATLSVRNRDDKCFMYSLLAKQIPGVKHDTALTEQSFTFNNVTYNFDGISFPVSMSGINQFQRLNPRSSVNVYECDSECIITPLRVVDKERPDHTNLLLYRHPSGSSHFLLILDFNKLMRPQLCKDRHKITVCTRCFCFKETRKCSPSPEAWLENHNWFCKEHKPTPIYLPPEDKAILQFTDFHTQIPLPIICVADFEAYLRPTASTDNSYEFHDANSFCTLIKTSFPEQILNDVGLSTEPYVCMSDEAGKQFLLHIKDIAQRVEKLYSRNTPMVDLTLEESERYAQATSCFLCNQLFNELSINARKVHDHCHVQGTIRHGGAPICSACNIKARQPTFVPIFIHNLSGYDSGHIIKNLDVLKDVEVKIIPANSEKLIAFSIRIGKIWIRFLDSYRFLSQSLATLAESLPQSSLIESSKLVPHDKIHLVKSKGVYPYSYVRDASVFDETKLPPREAFFNDLTGEDLPESDYQHALDVWKTLNMGTFLDYHMFYLRLDTCILADVITAFREKFLETYKIDCAQTWTAPGLSWAALLRTSKINLELLTCPDMLLFVEKGIRGGLTSLILRYARANNSDLEVKSDYDPSKEQSFLSYFDCTNLYGNTMKSFLPYGNFKWTDPDTFNWNTLPDDSPIGCFLECDVEYPIEVHDLMKDLPLLPEIATPPGGKCKKLLATLLPKNRYIAHYRIFKQAIQLGLKITKVHRVLTFSQSPFIAPYVERNAALRAQATDKFGKSFWKLVSNAAFGKTMENTRSRVDVKVVTSESALQKLVRQARFVERRIISKNVVLVIMKRQKVVMDKPIYIGMSILDISKEYMFNFHYNILANHFKSINVQLNLAYLDTDGLVYHIVTEKNLTEILKTPSLSVHFDGSVYPPDHPLRCDTNKGRLGTFKDECGGRAIFEFVGLRPKAYAIRFNSNTTDDPETKLKAKGIKSSYVKNNLKFQHYLDTLFDITPTTRPPKAQFNLIRCKNFNLTSIRITRKSLCPLDDKRHILPCKIKTLPFGHYSLTAEEDGSDMHSDDD